MFRSLFQRCNVLLRFFFLRKRYMFVILSLLFAFIAFCFALVYIDLGRRPSEEDHKRFFSSRQFNSHDKTFANRRAGLIKAMTEKNFSFELIRELFSSSGDRVPLEPLPQITPDMSAFAKADSSLKVVWFGHSSFILNLSGSLILVDPVFSGAASPLPWLVKRFQPPVIPLKNLPKVDVVLISHDHYDHLDKESIQFFRGQDVRFVVPLGVGSHLKSWGISQEKIIEKDWWQSFHFNGVQYTATPAQHFSGRGLTDRNRTLWASWALQSEKHSVFFSGDSGYDSHFKEIGERLGPFDIAFLESGQYNSRWREVHMLPEEGLQAFFDLKAKYYFPIHWGMFKLAFHPWYEPIEKLYSAKQENRILLLAPKIGQIVDFEKIPEMIPWWKKVSRKLF